MKKSVLINSLPLEEIKQEAKKRTVWVKIIPFLNIILDVLIDKLLDAILTKYNVTKK